MEKVTSSMHLVMKPVTDDIYFLKLMLLPSDAASLNMCQSVSKSVVKSADGSLRLDVHLLQNRLMCFYSKF